MISDGMRKLFTRIMVDNSSATLADVDSFLADTTDDDLKLITGMEFDKMDEEFTNVLSRFDDYSTIYLEDIINT